MDKENGDNNEKGKGGGHSGGGSGQDPSSLLDAASLFAYWGRDSTAAQAAAAASSQLFGSPFGAAAAGLGLLPSSGGSNNDRYSMNNHQHHQNTMAVAASQAASLAGLHPASWWSMAQLAAQDYFARLQASGLSPFQHPELAAAFPGMGMGGSVGGSSSGSGRQGSGDGKNNSKSRKEKKSNNNSNSMGGGSGNSSTTITSSAGTSSAYKQSSAQSYKSAANQYSPATLHKELLAMQAAAAAASASASNSGHGSSRKSNQSSHNVIGVKSVSAPTSSNSISYDKIKYDLLIDINFTRLISDVRSSPEFCFKQITLHHDENVYLGLFFQPWLSMKQTENIRSKYRIIQRFFEIHFPNSKSHNENCGTDAMEEDGQDVVVEEVVEECNSMPSVSELYSMLREAHEKVTDKIVPDVKMPTHFIPELRSYQLKALHWMLNRERVAQFSAPEFVLVKCPYIPHQEFYYNYRTIELMDYDPGGLKVPTGGILADEMGLGKTVEMLALILTNPNLKRKRIDNDDDEEEAVLSQKLNRNQILKCVCHRSHGRKTIQCSKCLFFQHEKCVTKYAKRPIMNYICPDCWKLEPTLQSSTTFIVSPPSIKMQWNEEIQKHIANNHFKVLIYDGIKQSGWISPKDLTTYDIVLTDYNTMKTEIYYSQSNKRDSIMRSQPRYIIPTSPLTMIQWFRVVLDEAQMVETPKNNCSKMVKSLPAVHRWAVTGTPIEKSIDNLYGLMFFLDYEPFTDINTWKNLTLAFNQGDMDPLINQCLKNVMWRTCKINVWQEIGIPPQTEIVHNVTMSDSQAFFYSDQHAQCAMAFYEKAQKLGKSLSMFRMNPKTLKLIMTPLRKLRQDCTVPTIFQKSNRHESTVKKILTPDELLKHMVNNNENNCKERLRMIASCLNGIAALHIIKSEFDIAVKMYKSVLRWAKDYTGTICVDSLLQVHALHNLLEVSQILNDSSAETTDEYTKELERLEWKYLENSISLVKMARARQMKIENDVITRTKEAEDWKFRWWSDFLSTTSSNQKLEQQIMDRIHNELRNYQNPSIESVSSSNGVMYVVGTWLDKIQVERKEIQKWFKKLEFFATNLKPRCVLSPENLGDIDMLVKSAFDCHLDREDEKKTTKKKRTLCLLCQVKQVMLKYECLIFDKTFVDDIDRENLGSWNPSFQEAMLRVTYSFAKRELADESDIKDAEIHLQVIELIKDEYKEYSQYWVEVNYAAAAYDELKMCKSRMEIFDPDIEEEPKKSKLKVSKYEVNDTIIELRQEKQVAEGNFVRLQGVLKYLKHLEDNKEPDMCPICKEIPTMKYCVLQCGHHFCYDCFLRIVHIHKTNYKCCICRHSQKMNEIHFVTCKKKESNVDDNTVSVAGDYSSKIEDIIRTTLTLCKEDPNVKIIIFSHWETILNVIATALTENGVQHRSKSAKFHRSIDEFKNKDLKITCLLLPLMCGSKGLNLIEATHVFLVEPILNPAEEFQAIGRIHRIGQTKPTFVHRFIVLNTIEETIFNTISNDKTGKWKTKEVTVDNLKELFTLNKESN